MTVLLPNEWNQLVETAHPLVFNEPRSAGFDRADRVIFAATKDKEPIGYVTIKEWDRDAVYLQHGGVFPKYKKSYHVKNLYERAISEVWRMGFKRLYSTVATTNAAMIRLNLAMGLNIVGIKQRTDELYLEFHKEKGN